MYVEVDRVRVYVVCDCVMLIYGGIGCDVKEVSVCPSGLRGYVQVVMFSNAWVQIPQLTDESMNYRRFHLLGHFLHVLCVPHRC